MADDRAFAAAGVEGLETIALKTCGSIEGALVPSLARLVLLEARARIDDEKRGYPLGVGTIKGEGHVSAERKPADDGSFRANDVKQSSDVADRQFLAIGRGIVGIIGLAVAAHVP